MKKKNKIIVITECPYSGILTAILEHSKIFKKMGFELYFIVPLIARDRYGEKLSHNINLLKKIGNVLYTPLNRKYSEIKKDKRELGKLLSNFTNYVLLSYTSYAGKLTRMLYRENKIKILYHIPQCIDIIRRPIWQRPIEFYFEKKLSNFSTGYIAYCNNEANLLNIKFNINKNKIHTIHNFINKDPKKNNLIKQYDFLFLGRVSKDKGLEKILKMAKKIKLLKKFVVIGDGPLLPYLKKKFPEANYKGNLTKNKIFSYLYSSKFIISNSIIEGLPFSIIEAMHCGTIPILSDIDSHKELIINKKSGFLFKNITELKKIVLELTNIDDFVYNKISMRTYKKIKYLSNRSKLKFINYFKKYE